MNTEKYRTGAKRIWAAIVDGIVFMPFLLIDRYLIYPANNENLSIAWKIFTVFIPIFYSTIAHYKYGQTIGKWVAGVKVLDITETKKIGLAQSFTRDAVYLLVELASLVYYSVLVLKTGDKSYLSNGFSGFAETPFGIWPVLELITMLTNEKRRAIHDFLAKSVVVRIE